MMSLPFKEKMISSPKSREEVPVVALLSHLLLKAHEFRASDLHLEPFSDSLRLRFRIDGALEEIQFLPKKLQESLVNRLKIMSGSMDIAEKRIPQEGRFAFTSGAKMLDVRISILPTVYGESIVLRFLDRSSLSLGLHELGLEKEDQNILKKLITMPHGLLLVTGPTGSGKTTTLYACLEKLKATNSKIITVEDPIEYQLPGINQVQVQKNIGRTFASVLRASLRQATNTMMVGEIRDAETAQIAINASLTGHLILSTLHTNDAPTTIMRLEDMKIPHFLITSALHAIIAQRLVRRLCPHCKVPATFTTYEKKIFSVEEIASPLNTPMKASGCSECQGKGFQGRLGIFEILLMNDYLRDAIQKKQTITHLREQARNHGMRTLREDGLKKVLAGLTTVQEVLAQTLC
jgi:type II secretory ATPase GspE/PulE/Tfp pilus assembly ATPase PilB-like protein